MGQTPSRRSQPRPRAREPLQARSRATRAKILDAAAELTQKQGFERTTMAEVAQQAGVGTGTLYRHFPDKRALLLELFDRWSERVAADRRGDLQAESLMREDPREFFAVWLRTLYERMHDRNRFYTEIHPLTHRDEELRERYDRLKRQGAERMATFIELGQKTGRLRKEPDPTTAAVLMINALELLGAHVLQRPGSETERMLHELTDMFCRYLMEDR